MREGFLPVPSQSLNSCFSKEFMVLTVLDLGWRCNPPPQSSFLLREEPGRRFLLSARVFEWVTYPIKGS
jgi:hypothetical protein